MACWKARVNLLLTVLELLFLSLTVEEQQGIGNIKILFMISECTFKELEVIVKFYEYYNIFYSVIRV